MTGGCLTAEEYLLTDDTSEKRKVELPAPFSGFVWVRMLTVAEREAFERQTFRDDDKGVRNVRARLAVLACCDADGKPIFKPYHAAVLANKGARALDAIYDAVAELNGWTSAAVKELEKNCEATGEPASDSSSPVTSP